MRRRQKFVVWLTTMLVAAVLGTMMSASPATADPGQGWMPNPPKTLNSEQKSMLTELPKDSEDKPRYGDQAQTQYRMIDCQEHTDFKGCEKHPDSEDSKNIQGVIYDTDGNYQGVWAATPGALAREHAELADDKGVIDCAKLANKLPSCAMPELMAPKPPLAMKFDKATGEFVGFRQENGDYGLPTGSGAEESCFDSDGAGGVAGMAHRVGNAAKCMVNSANPSKAAEELLDNWFAQAAETVGKFAGDLLVLSMTWWLRTDSINVTSGGILAGERPIQVVVLMIIVLGIIGSAAGMVMMRRAGPAAELGMGALKFVLIASLAGIVVAGAMNAADDFAKQIITSGTDNFGPHMKQMLGIATLRNPGGVLTLGVVAVALSFIQWVIGFARQAGLVILFALLIFAAAGQVSTWGRQWFPRISAMMLSLILYKPFAAAIYKIGFNLMGDEESLSSVMVGLMTIALAIIALPTMLKFFDFAATSVAGGASVGGVLAAAGIAGAAGASMMPSGGGGSGGGDAQSNYMASTGPGTNGGPEADPSPGNSPNGPGNGPDGNGSSGEGPNSEAAQTPEADVGNDGMGPASEASPGSGESDGVPLPGSTGAENGAAEGTAADGATSGATTGAAGAHPAVTAAFAAKEGLNAAGNAAESLASDATGSSANDETGPGM